jgi:hypothetical protein
LSAILLDDAYYEFILAGRREVDGLPWVGEDRLIPLKASAWLDLGERQAKGEPIDTKNIRKHANDVLRLSQLLAPDTFAYPSPKNRAGSEPLPRRDRGRSLDRSEVAQDQQQRRRDCRTDRAGLRLESTARDVIAMR